MLDGFQGLVGLKLRDRQAQGAGAQGASGTVDGDELGAT